MGKRMTPIERFIAEIPDRRRAYDARMVGRGLKRVNVMVPTEHVEAIKTFARLLRNSDPEDVAQYRQDLEEYLGDVYRAMDDDIASGRYVPGDYGDEAGAPSDSKGAPPHHQKVAS